MVFYNYDTGAFRGYCVLCGNGYAKRELDRILCRNGSYGSPKTMAYVCRSCMTSVADFLGVELPDMDATEHRQYSGVLCPKCMTYCGSSDRYCRKCGINLKKAKEEPYGIT